ncbi:hypothetical protein EV421DRAFT_1914027 [Armillaria borealis]|uniref:Uncharacterized protein n=1 Tax=Armillaria borealis TaxID=47425 RepID=A0AA39ITZ7_9AGAR|nr:hypothetical protein EV421DRAFT_1914027 [Armillaria borealis]
MSPSFVLYVVVLFAGSADNKTEHTTMLAQQSVPHLGSHSVYFLAWFVKTHDIPKIHVDSEFGGLATIGRSLGTTTYVHIDSCHDINVASVPG